MACYLVVIHMLLVALSRAKEGLFVLGNAPQMAAKSDMWHDVITNLEQVDCVGPALPIACHQHPDTVEWVSKPGTLAKFAPDGKFREYRHSSTDIGQIGKLKGVACDLVVHASSVGIHVHTRLAFGTTVCLPLSYH